MASTAGSFPLVAVGASAGGVEALWVLLAALPKDFPGAVMVAMHIPSHTSSHLQDVLGRKSALPVQMALDGETVVPGRVYVPQPDRHLLVQGATVRVSRGPKENRMRPAINVLFRAVAESFGPRAIGVILTGMLDDGVAGLWSIKHRGGLAFVQDPADALCDAMPRAALEYVAADGVAALVPLAGEITQAARSIAARPAAAMQELGIESRIAAGIGGQDVLKLGTPSRFTCPECHGVLAEIREGPLLRYRCHTGHAYSFRSLAADLDRTIDESLWNTIRALEEKVLLIEDALPDEREVARDADLRVARGQLEALRDMALSTGTR